MATPVVNSEQLIKRQTQVSSHFFRSEKINKKEWKEAPACKKTMEAFTQSRTTKDASSPITVKGMSLRAIVIADAACTLLEGKKYEEVYDSSYKNKQDQNVDLTWTREETLQVFTPRGQNSCDLTSVQKIQGAHPNHKGDCRLDFAHEKAAAQQVPSYIDSHWIGSYGWILDKIDKFGGLEEQKKIASLLLEHGTVRKEILPKLLAKKLEIENCTDIQMKNFEKMQNLLAEPSNFTILKPIMLDLANGQTTFLEIMNKMKKGSANEMKLIEELEPLFTSIQSDDNPVKEKALASLLLRYALPTRRFYPITKDVLEKRGINSSPENIQFLNDLFGLLFIKEISRRLNPQNKSVDLPYAISLIRGLKLIGKTFKLKNGGSRQLTFGHLFHKENGRLFFTKPSLLQKNDPGPSKEVITELNKMYEFTFPQEAQESRKPKAMMSELSRYFGGASDTDEDSYDDF